MFEQDIFTCIAPLVFIACFIASVFGFSYLNSRARELQVCTSKKKKKGRRKKEKLFLWKEFQIDKNNSTKNTHVSFTQMLHFTPFASSFAFSLNLSVSLPHNLLPYLNMLVLKLSQIWASRALQGGSCVLLSYSHFFEHFLTFWQSQLF